MTKITVNDCLGVIRSLMERRAREMEKVDESNVETCEIIHAEYFALAEAYQIIEAFENTPRTHKNALQATPI